MPNNYKFFSVFCDKLTLIKYYYLRYYFTAGAAKVASHPPKNITEQKLLDSYLYDMSRQRFNFIVQCHLEKKLFLEKQKRKTSVMKDLLRNVDLSGFVENPLGLAQSTATGINQKHESDRKKWNKESQTSDPKISRSRAATVVDGVLVTHRIPRISDQKTEVPTKPYSDSRSIFTSTTKTVQSKNFYSKESKASSSPLNDSRYRKLSEVLSENYPKSSSLHLRKGRANPLTAKTIDL